MCLPSVPSVPPWQTAKPFLNFFRCGHGGTEFTERTHGLISGFLFLYLPFPFLCAFRVSVANREAVPEFYIRCATANSCAHLSHCQDLCTTHMLYWPQSIAG